MRGPQTRAAIVGIPFDCGTHPSRIGARMGPASIRQWSSQLRRHNLRLSMWQPSSASSTVATSR